MAFVLFNGVELFFHVASPDDCTPDPVRAEGWLFGHYAVWKEWSLADDKVCQCIENTAAAIPPGIYDPIPQNSPCGLKPTCNSNYVAKCLLSHCGLDATFPGKDSVGWNHRMKTCTKFVETGDKDPDTPEPYCCTCLQWRTDDAAWCSERSRDQL